MIEERFTDAERVRLLQLAFAAVPHGHGDDEITRIIAKLSGTDTVLLAHRAYPSSRQKDDLPALVSELQMLTAEMVQMSSDMVDVKSLNMERMTVLSSAIRQDIERIEKWLKSQGFPLK